MSRWSRPLFGLLAAVMAVLSIVGAVNEETATYVVATGMAAITFAVLAAGAD